MSRLHTIQTGSRAPSEPPTAASREGTASIRPLVVVDVRRTERHSVCPEIRYGITVKGVTGVAMVAGHVQGVVVVL